MFCPKCGKECAEGTVYCSGCGTRLAGGGRSVPGLETVKAYLPEMNATTYKVLAAMVLLLIGMFLWHKELAVIDLKLTEIEITGLDVLGGSGFLKLVINLAHLAAIAYAGYTLAVKSERTTVTVLPMIIVAVGMLLGMGIAAVSKVNTLISQYKWLEEVKNYIKIEYTSSLWFGVLTYLAVAVLGILSKREITYNEWNSRRVSVIVHSMEGKVAEKKADSAYGSSIEWVTIRQGNGTERVFAHDTKDPTVINVGERCTVKYTDDKITEYRAQ